MRLVTLAAIASCLAAATAITATTASAKDPSAQQIARERHRDMEKVGRAFKEINRQMKRPAPSISVIREQSGFIADYMARMDKQYPTGSGQQDGVKTDALATIWARPADFKLAVKRAKDTSKELEAAALRSDIGRVRAAIGPVGGSCKGCHDNFRNND
ncbi:MAG: cytochrome c [Novosphingobium sp.]